MEVLWPRRITRFYEVRPETRSTWPFSRLSRTASIRSTRSAARSPRILGYGEISTVFEIQAPGLRGLACKRLPIFRLPAELERYQSVYEDYNRLLTAEAGLCLPPYGYAAFVDAAGRPVFYILQAQLPSASIGNRLVHSLDAAGVAVLFGRVLEELARVWQFNARQTARRIGIDGQISNWAMRDYDPAGGSEAGAAVPALLYLDTSTPLFRVDGVEQLDPELFLRSAPSFLVWLLRMLFLKDVLDRYYDFHLVVVDLIANFYKEQVATYVPALVTMANQFLAGPAAGLGVAPVAEAEVRAYYRQDRLIWSLFLAMRKLDRDLHTRLWRRRYPYILPGPIRR